MATSWGKILSLANIAIPKNVVPMALLNREKLRYRFLGILPWVPQLNSITRFN